MLKQLYIIVLFCFWATFYAQEPIRYTTKQGLPTNHVYDMAEDSDGFMWFATKQGLVKYDGESFKTFTTQDGLPNNDTWKLETDHNGRVYYFSKSAYQGYVEKDSIYKFATKDKEVLAPSSVYKGKNNFWFYANGIKSYKNNKISDYGFNIYKSLDLTNELLKNHHLKKEQLVPLINPEKKETVYINLREKEIYFYDWDFNLIKTIIINVPELKLSSSFIDSGLTYSQLGYYVFDSGILFIDFKDYSSRFLSFKEVFGDKISMPMYFKLKSTPYEIQINIPGHLAILDFNLNVKETYQFSEELGQHSFKDSNGNIWLNNISNGVSLIRNTQIQSQYFFKDLKVQKINVLDSVFYVGVNNKGIYELEPNTNQKNELLQFNIPHSEIYQIKKDKISNKKIAVIARHTYELSKNNAEEIKINNTTDNSLINEYSSGGKDYFSYDGNDYIVNSSVIIKCGFNNDLSEILISKQGLLGSRVYKKTAYISGSDGLFLFKNEKLKPFNNKLLNVPINTLFSNQDFLFIGTDGRGLFLYDEKNIHHIKASDGLSIQKIITKDNYTWLASQKGVFKIQLNQNYKEQSTIVDAYYESDGLLQNNTNDIYLDNKFLFAATDIGLAKLNLNNIVYKQQPNVYFKTQNDTLIYKNSERDNVTITFALHNYINQEHVKYQYRLLPTQKDWINTTTKTLNFNNLSPNLYTLEIKATDQHNNHSISKQFLKVVPAWWETTLAKIGFILLGICSLFLLIRYTKNSIRKKVQAKAEQEKRMAGLELQALRSQMNPHFVHNSLNAIQYFIQRNEVELSENYLSKFSQLIRLFFEYSRRQTVTIKEELDLLTNYLEIEKLRFEEKLQYNISVCDNIDVEEQLIPSMLLQPIVENAVNHGLFHKKEQGNVKVLFKQLEDSSYQVTVKDDGIGIKKSKHIFKASSKNYQSNSSKVLHERLDLLNKSNEWHIKYQIQDISDIDNSKTGTVVSLTFKQMYEQ